MSIEPPLNFNSGRGNPGTTTGRPMLLAIDLTLALHRAADHLIEVLSGLIIWRDDEGRVRGLSRTRARSQSVVARAGRFHECGLGDRVVRQRFAPHRQTTVQRPLSTRGLSAARSH